MPIKILPIIAIVTFYLTPLIAYATETNKQDPFAMIQMAANNTFESIKKKQDQIAKDPKELRTILKEELMPYIDHRFSAFKVLGRHARSIEKEDLIEYVSVFQQYLIATYSSAMSYYQDQTVEFEPSINFKNKTNVTVRAVVKDKGKPDIKIAFKVRKNKRTGEWLVYDMLAEGISLLASKRSEFESMLRINGIQAVIMQMREVIERPIGPAKEK
jgi:phospholipid transport system substrate-binding protein